MSKPIPDKAEVAVEYPDKLYIGTFERSARFDAHLDKTGVSLTLYRLGDTDVRKSVRVHFHYSLFANILHDLANTIASFPPDDVVHHEALQAGAEALYRALSAKRVPQEQTKDKKAKDGEDASDLTPKDEVALLHVLE
jgi:hypothetical protein